MTLQRICVWLAFVASFGVGLKADEGEPVTTSGVRPFYVEWPQGGERREYTILYPLFFYRSYGQGVYKWSVFQLINGSGGPAVGPNAAEAKDETFDLWPFYFSRDTGDPATSYRAVFPIYGWMQDFLSYPEVRFVLWPFYMQLTKRGAVTTSTPWPFIRVTRGAEQGFALWPLYVQDRRPGEFDRHFYLWPFIWNNHTEAVENALGGYTTGPSHEVGVLPFYAGTFGPTMTSENYLWPFFGYTDQTVPYRYHETRYFWPFFVQGRGDDHYHNRWGPFYTHSVVKGVDKVWAPFPLYRCARWQDGDIEHTKTQIFYFVYWKWDQAKVSNPSAPHAYKEHFWPVASIWDNGAGRREWQALSPVEVFFPDNREMRETWSPLFAFCRHSEEPDGSARTSLFWNALSWERRADGGSRWRLFALKFSHPPSKVAVAASH